ncbi:30S ribosomal protein S9 [Candidatus Vidania fulgoroideorum]
MLGFNFFGIGRKKNSISRVFLKKGNGKILINNNNLNHKIHYFLIREIFDPIILANFENFDFIVYTKGGGKKSQIDATKIAISNSILDFDIRYKNIFRFNNLLIDNRIVERKKIGFKKSRKKKQFSKR